MAKHKNKIFNNKPNIEFIETNVLNSVTFSHYLRCFKKLCLSMFEWQNLPKGMNERFLEEVLYYNAMASLIYDEKYGFINTACVFSGNLNIYGLATKYNCFSYGFNTIRKLYTGLKNEEARKEDCILVLNNQDMESTFSSMELFAYRLYKCDRISDINLEAQKTPIIIKTTENNKLSMQNAYAQYNGNAPVIITKKNNFDTNDFDCINISAPFVMDKIQNQKKEIWNEALTFLGINNLNDKKERMVSDEVNQNNEVVNLNLQSFLIPRQNACKEFNELFKDKIDNEISVRVRSDLKNIIKNMESIVTDYIPNEKEGVFIDSGKIIQ